MPNESDEEQQLTELQQQIASLSHFDDVCSSEEHQFLSRQLDKLFQPAKLEIELPFVWHERYRLTRYLGGGMSDVFLAEQMNLNNRAVVVKILPVSTAQDQSKTRELFREEAATLAIANRREASSIVFPIDSDVFDDRPYLVMEYVEGRTIAQIGENEQLSVVETIDLIASAAQSLASAHALGIVHGDIKPTNMILRSDRTVQLIDFGLSSLFKNPDRPNFAGTPKYAAPEQHSGGPVDARTDIYGLGVVLKKLLANAKANSSDPQSQQRLRRATEIANRMTAYSKEDRPDSAKEVARQLQVLDSARQNSLASYLIGSVCVFVALIAACWIYVNDRSEGGSNQLTVAMPTEDGDQSLESVAKKAVQTRGQAADAPAASTIVAESPAAAGDDRESVMKWIKSVGGHCKQDYQGRVDEVYLRHCWVNSSCVGKFNVFPHLTRVIFSDTDIDSDGVSLLRQAEIGTLMLNETKTDDRIFNEISRSSYRLTSLGLAGTKITGVGLKTLPHPTRIESIWLSETKISDADAPAIAAMSRLKTLHLASTDFTTVGLRAIKHLDLRELNLSKCPIDDAAVAEIAQIETLQSVSLYGCKKLTGNCVNHLLKMKNLKAIGLEHCNLSDADILRLKQMPSLTGMSLNPSKGRDLEMLRRELAPKIIIH